MHLIFSFNNNFIALSGNNGVRVPTTEILICFVQEVPEGYRFFLHVYVCLISQE